MRKAIDRQGLRMLLDLPERLPPDFEARFEDVDCPTVYWRWAQQSPEVWSHDQMIAVTATVIVKPSKRYFHNGKAVKVSNHRVYVICPYCRREIPAGRWHQHEGTCVKS